MTTKDMSVLPPIYQICIQERLDSNWADWFDGLSFSALPDGKTLLCGPVIDQAALNGLLNKVHHLNLTLISVQRVEAENEPVISVQSISEDTPQEPQ